MSVTPNLIYEEL